VSWMNREREVREMRDAKTVLTIIRERGKRGLPLERVYRLLYNPELYLKAYGKIYRNDGALTPGSTEETADGMSLAKIGAIIDALRRESYRWRPARRVYIEKQGSEKPRPLGLPTFSDKLLQEVIRLILEAYYDPQFSDRSHGFRPGRGCHTALTEIQRTWKGTAWFIEGDISDCFGSLDHEVLLAILQEKIHDGRFLRLIANLLKAGYLEDWRFNDTLSGSPQGGVVSPILSNIYLDRLDRFVENTLLPQHNRGARRKGNPEYERLKSRARRLAEKGLKEEAAALHKQAQRVPSLDPDDPRYRRLRYVRYADDFLLGFAGPRKEAEGIKRRLKEFLRDDLNLRRNKPVHRMERVNDSVFGIVARYQQEEYRGIAEYYQLAYNRSTRLTRLEWVMEQSLTKTLAKKLRVSVKKVYARYKTTIRTDKGLQKVLRVEVEREGGNPLVAQWGGVPLTRPERAVLKETPLNVWNDNRSELLQRLLADRCELCGSREKVQVHHVRSLKDLKRKGRAEKPEWVKRMAARRRKTLIVCHECHTDIHAGRRLRKTAKGG
jgi:group II intron reverse transcriptase/maturase